MLNFFCICDQCHSRTGVSNSTWLGGRLRLNVRSRGPHWKKFIFNFELKSIKQYIGNGGKMIEYFFKILNFLVVRGPHWTLSRPACGLGPRVWDSCSRTLIYNRGAAPTVPWVNWKNAVGRCASNFWTRCPSDLDVNCSTNKKERLPFDPWIRQVLWSRFTAKIQQIWQ